MLAEGAAMATPSVRLCKVENAKWARASWPNRVERLDVPANQRPIKVVRQKSQHCHAWAGMLGTGKNIEC